MRTLSPLSITVALALLLCAARAGAQAPPQDLFPSHVVDLGTITPLVTGDVDGDGHLDLIADRTKFSPVGLSSSRGDGLGGFLPVVVTSIAPDKIDSLSAGDFDHDGRTDVAYVNFPTNQVRVWHGASDGSFVAPLTLPLAHAGVARRLTLCDTNEDGHLDLIASQSDTSRLTLYFGTGAGDFVSPPTEITGSPQALFLEHGDFDGDGHVDLVEHIGVANAVTGVLWGHGDGTFEAPVSHDESNVSAVGDLSGDGHDDLIGYAYVGGVPQAYWSWQPGQGFVLTPIVTEFIFTNLRATGVGDVDRDGVDELLLGYKDGQLDLFGPRSDGTLEVVGRYATCKEPTSLAVLDLDEDGGLDVVAGQVTGTILSGRGNGELQPQYRLDAPVLDEAVADLTGDGLPDVVAVCGAVSPAQLLRGRLGGGLLPPESFDAGPEPKRVWLLDATGDGQLDVLSVGGTTIAVAAGDGAGHFAPPLLSVQPTNIVWAEPADFGGDGLTDLGLILAEPPSSGGRYVHFLINSAGSFSDVGNTLVAPPGTTVDTFRAADVDGDADLDLLVNWSAGYLRVFINNPTGYEPGFLDAGNGDGFVMHDLDLDGDLDILDPNYDLGIRFNDGAGNFSEPTVYDLNVSSHSAVIEDLNHDGLPDVILCGTKTTTFTGTLPIFVGYGVGAGQFGAFTKYPANALGLALRAADMNADGETDVVLALEGNQILLLENGQGPWEDLGYSLEGAGGFSRLEGFGTLEPGSTVSLLMSNGLPGAPTLLIAGMNTILLPFKGGVLVPQPTIVQALGPLDGQGSKLVSGTWPATMPPGASFAMQVWRAEAGAPSGFAATTAIRGTSP